MKWNLEELCRVSYESVYVGDWDKADPKDKEDHRVLVAAVLYAQADAAA